MYTVWVLGPDMKINRVIVDPADGHVLLNVPISMNHIMEMMGLEYWVEPDVEQTH
jgi:hypothetical protein